MPPVPEPPAANGGRNRNSHDRDRCCRARRRGADRRQHPIRRATAAATQRPLRRRHDADRDHTSGRLTGRRHPPDTEPCSATRPRRCGCSSSRISSARSARRTRRRAYPPSSPSTSGLVGSSSTSAESCASAPIPLKALRIAVAAGFQDKLWQVVGLFYANQGAGELGLGHRRPDRRDPRGGARARCGQGQGGCSERRSDQGDRGGPGAVNGARGARYAVVLHRRRVQSALFDPGSGIHAERVPCPTRRRPLRMSDCDRDERSPG